MTGEPLALALEELAEGGGSAEYPTALRDAYRVFEFAGQGKGDPAGARIDGARVGLMELPPGTSYPPHVHPAAEIYVIISGRCRWSAGGRVRELSAISFAYHPPNVAHAIEALGEEPLRIVYAWWGDPADLAADARLEPRREPPTGAARWPR